MDQQTINSKKELQTNSYIEEKEKKSIKQLFKQIILPKLIQSAEIQIVFPVFEQNEIIEKQCLKHSLVYYVIRDLIEMNQDIQNVSNFDKTPRNLVSLQCQSGLIITVASFLDQEEFFIKTNLKLQRSEFSDKTPSSGMGSDMITSLQSQIEDLKSQVNSQNTLINKLCYQQLEQQIQQKLRTSNSNLSRQNMYNNRSGHQRHRSKRGSGDYDQVIIEEEEQEEDQQTQDNNNNDESKFNGEISIVAAANNQGDPNQQDQSTNMLEDLSMLRKLSLEINRNYEKFAELRKSLNIFGGGGTKSNNTTQGQMQLESSGFNTNGYNSNSNVTPTPNSNKNGGSSNQPQNTIQNIIRKSLNFNNQPVINNQNLTSNFVELGSQVSIAADIERQFRLLVDQKNKEKIVIEEALLHQKHKQKQQLQQDSLSPTIDIQKLLNLNQINDISKNQLSTNHLLNILDSDRSQYTSSNNHVSNKYQRPMSQTGEITLKTNLNTNKMETKQSFEAYDDEDSFDVGEESVANETELNFRKSQQSNKLAAHIVPLAQLPQRLIDNLNSTQSVKIPKETKTISINLPPKNANKIMKHYNTDALNDNIVQQSMQDTQRTQRYSQFNKTSLKSQGNTSSVSFHSAQTILAQNQKAAMKAKTKLKGQNGFVLSSQSSQALKLTSQSNYSMSVKGNQTQNFSQTKAINIDLSKPGRLNSKSKQNSLSLSTTNQQQSGYQSIVNSAAQSLKNLTIRNQEKRKCSQSKHQVNEQIIPNINSKHNKISALKEEDHESFQLEPEPASRSPSIKDERGSIMPLEKPKGFMMQEKNHHPLYFKVQSNDPSVRTSLVRKSNFSSNGRPTCDILIDDDNHESISIDQKIVIQSGSNENLNMIPLPRQSLSKKNKMVLRQSQEGPNLRKLNQQSISTQNQSKQFNQHIYLKQKRPSTSTSHNNNNNQFNSLDHSQANQSSNGYVIQLQNQSTQNPSSREHLKSMDIQERAMIAKFYNNQPHKQEDKAQLNANKVGHFSYEELNSFDMRNQQQINAEIMNNLRNDSSNRRLTDLKEARIKNRSESRQNQNNQSRDMLNHVQQQIEQISNLNCSKQFVSNSNQNLNNSQQIYNSLNRSGNYSSSLRNVNSNHNTNNNQSNLDETIQVVRDILQVKRNLSQSNLTQVNIQNQNHSSGLNASILFERQNIQNSLNDSINLTHSSNLNLRTQKKPPIRQNKHLNNQTPMGMNTDLKSSLISLGKENLDGFFVLYENFKQNGGQQTAGTQFQSSNNSFINNHNSINHPTFINTQQKHHHSNSNFNTSQQQNANNHSQLNLSYQNNPRRHKGVLSPESQQRIQLFNPNKPQNLSSSHQNSRQFLNPQSTSNLFHMNNNNQSLVQNHSQYQIQLQPQSVQQQQQRIQQQQNQNSMNMVGMRGRSTSEYSNLGMLNGLTRPLISKNNQNIQHQREL
eukprot:403353733